MKKTLASIPALTVGLLSSALVLAAPPAADPVAAAFERMLNHAPAHAAPAAVASASTSDPLLDHLVASLARHRTGSPTETASPDAHPRRLISTPEDQLAASFQRMLGHESGNGEAQHAADTASDPLLTQLTAALWPARATATPEKQQP